MNWREFFLLCMLALVCLLAAVGLTSLQHRVDRLEACPALRGCPL